MALILCKDCNKEFSNDAKRCPHCGAKPKKKAKKWSGKEIGLMFLVIVLLGSILNLVDPPKPLPDRDIAPQMCQDFVKKTLHDPGSADFDWWTEYPIAQEKDGVFYVLVSLRAKNAFNAIRKTAFECRVKRTSPTKWELVSLKEL